MFWTSNKSINGLRHFVLLNKINEQNKINFLMVSVIDVEINFTISNEELFNSRNWNEGWLNLPKNEAITKDYLDYKLGNNSKEGIKKVLLVFGKDDKPDDLNLAIRNIPLADTINQVGLNVYDVLKKDYILFTEQGLKEFEDRLSK